VKISNAGLELIDWDSAYCIADGRPWHSDAEIWIDKRGLVSQGGKKSKDFWDATLPCPRPPRPLPGMKRRCPSRQV